MNSHNLFNPGTPTEIIPEGDAARQAVDALRGYAYQALATTLAWLDIDENSRLYLEVAEDYAVIAEQAFDAVQVKDTENSGSVTLNSPNIREAVAAFVDLVERNPNKRVDLRFFTTSEIGTEQAVADRPAGMAGLEYWRKVATGADPSPLRTILESDKFHESVRTFSKNRDDTALLHDLIERIHWDCGQPNFSTLRQELEARLIVVCRDQFNLPSQEVQGLADHLVYRVLEKSIVKATEDRVLTRAELYRVIDAATRISVPRAFLEALTQLVPGLVGSLGGSLGSSNPLPIAETDLFIGGTRLPAPQGMLVRAAVESEVVNALENYGVGIIVGGSGLGKSIVSRAVAVAQGGVFFKVDFRNMNADETRRRLDVVFARIGGLPSSMLILEDLNHIDDASVTSSLTCVIEALRRRYRKTLITCHRQPSLQTLTNIGLNQGCVVDCPYFSEEEAYALVLDNGGDPEQWGRLAYVAGACGHPQLTHAFVIGIAARGWPVEEIGAVINSGLSTTDIDAARDAARRSLVDALPEGTRTLLYRLSLTIGRFNRSLALTVGEISPSVSQTGECMDQLIGPWIETVGRDLFRVSPLASSFGREMLPPDEQRHIHETIAVHMLREGTINANNFDTILMHALIGKSAQSLAMLALSVLSADSNILERLTEHLLFPRLFGTDVPIYPEEPLASGLLRLAQFKLVAATDEGNNISAIVAALFNEIDSLPEPKGETGRALEAMAAFAVLGTMGIANYLDDWVALLLRFKALIEVDEFLQGIVANVENAFDTSGANFFGMLFSVGSARLASVERLERVINALDKLDADERSLLLTPVDRDSSDYSLFINGPWATQPHGEDFDVADATIRYQRMAEKTRNWGIPPLFLQCSVAQAIMLDEYQNNKEGALAVLAEARAASGDDIILSRAIAKVHYRHDEHGAAFEIFHGIADQVGDDSPIERAFALREAAISAAKCGEWSQAERWFLDAQSAARLARSVDMDAMAVGLGADSAVAALKTGDTGRALSRLSEAIEALAGINPAVTLRAAYCHRIIRHAVLWTQSRITRRDVQIGGRPIAMEAGTCSNPDPLPAIRESPLSHIDVTRYMLAEAETAASLNVGITATLDTKLAEGPIPEMESSLRTQVIQTDIARLDAKGFAAHFTRYVESTLYFVKDVSQLQAPLNPIAPERRELPTLDKDGPFDSEAEQAAKSAILAYGICSALADRLQAMTELEVALDSLFSGPFPGQSVFDHWNEKSALSVEPDQPVITIIKILLQSDHVEPYDFWRAGLHFFEWINRSNFKLFLIPRLAAWSRAGWKRITTEEAFRLSSPRQTVPSIEEVLTIDSDDRSFIAKLILIASEAVGAPLKSTYRDYLDYLEAIAEGTESLSSAT